MAILSCVRRFIYVIELTESIKSKQNRDSRDSNFITMLGHRKAVLRFKFNPPLVNVIDDRMM